MQTVGVREFRDHATAMMSAGETLVIERHGTPIGFFVPIVAKDRTAGSAALGRLGDVVEEVLDQLGIDEDDLVAEIGRPRRR